MIMYLWKVPQIRLVYFSRGYTFLMVLVLEQRTIDEGEFYYSVSRIHAINTAPLVVDFLNLITWTR